MTVLNDKLSTQIKMAANVQNNCFPKVKVILYTEHTIMRIKCKEIQMYYVL